uniref:Uncharacterized protein n=1 Tax=Trichuris muris TaxID=70415 RepID=A0A5S6QJM0_TRIMR
MRAEYVSPSPLRQSSAFTREVSPAALPFRTPAAGRRQPVAHRPDHQEATDPWPQRCRVAQAHRCLNAWRSERAARVGEEFHNVGDSTMGGGVPGANADQPANGYRWKLAEGGKRNPPLQHARFPAFQDCKRR